VRAGRLLLYVRATLCIAVFRNLQKQAEIEAARDRLAPRVQCPFPEASKLSPSESEGRRQPDPNPEREMQLRLQERHPAEWEACEAVIRKALRKFPLEWSEFLALDDYHTTSPGRSTQPRGYYFNLAAESVKESKAALREKMRVPMGVKETPRCAKCKFGVMADGAFCDCAMGRDMAHQARRKQKQTATIQRWNLIDAQSDCQRCYGYAHDRETGEVCTCDAGQRLSHHIERQSPTSDESGARPQEKREVA
jgi:hypothetical protein